MITDSLPRVTIAHLPTPIEPLPRLTAQLGGPEIWVKRDDQTGLATGGNKARKLEFLVAEALEEKADTLVTCGAVQSNHARQTAAAAAKFGLDRVLVLGGEPPLDVQGNLLIDRLLGAEIVYTGQEPPQERMDDVARRLLDEGRTPYLVPYGGSSPVGVCGYVAAMEEMLDQCRGRDLSFDHVVLASSSGGTQAGLVVGARALGYKGHVLGISVAPTAAELINGLAVLATSTASLLGFASAFEPGDFDVNDEYVGDGYAVVGALERDAIRTVARAEGLLLDPVYTGRAFAGLMALIRGDALSDAGRILFWHTGGTGGLFAKSADLFPPAST